MLRSLVCSSLVVGAVLFRLSSEALAQTSPPSANPVSSGAENPPLSGSRSDDTAGAGGTWAMKHRHWYEPMIAEPRGAQNVILGLARGDEFEYMVVPGRRRIWDITLGAEAPIVGWESSSVGNLGPGANGWGVGLWLPVSFHMVSDHADPSSPIVNNDYRFGAQLKAVRTFSATTTRLSAKLQIGHESTHLGDEFTIHALEKYGQTFERVNVSYEALEWGLSFQSEPDGPRLAGNAYRVMARAGGIHAIGWFDSDDGTLFYSLTLLDGSRTLLPSKRTFEPLLGVELVPGSTAGGRGVLPWILKGWMPITSYDVRRKIVYDYQKVSADQEEETAWSHSLVVGIRHRSAADQSGSGRGIPDLIFKYYRGINPHGQFRNERHYTMMGFGLRSSF